MRFTVREAEDEALEVMDGESMVVCTCWMEPGFAHDIARALNQLDVAEAAEALLKNMDALKDALATFRSQQTFEISPA